MQFMIRLTEHHETSWFLFIQYNTYQFFLFDRCTWYLQGSRAQRNDSRIFHNRSVVLQPPNLGFGISICLTMEEPYLSRGQVLALWANSDNWGWASIIYWKQKGVSVWKQKFTREIHFKSYITKLNFSLTQDFAPSYATVFREWPLPLTSSLDRALADPSPLMASHSYWPASPSWTRSILNVPSEPTENLPEAVFWNNRVLNKKNIYT